MALLVRDRTADPLVASLATDILLTQQTQIGQMLGWLNLWRLPATGLDPPMTWMGDMPETSMAEMASPEGGMAGIDSSPAAMPGMATPAEIGRLIQLSGEAADAEVLRLMIRHHRGAIPMAEAALGGSNLPAVRGRSWRRSKRKSRP